MLTTASCWQQFCSQTQLPVFAILPLQVHLQGITLLRYISAAYFAFEALMVNQFKGSIVDCSSGVDAGLVSTAAQGFPNMNGVQRGIFNQLAQPQPRCVACQPSVDFTM
jgi:hypothetical protein